MHREWCAAQANVDRVGMVVVVVAHYKISLAADIVRTVPS